VLGGVLEEIRFSPLRVQVGLAVARVRKGRQADRDQPHGPKPTYDIVGFKSGRCRAFRLRWLVLVGKGTITQHDTVLPAQPFEAHTLPLLHIFILTITGITVLLYPILIPNSRKKYNIKIQYGIVVPVL